MVKCERLGVNMKLFSIHDMIELIPCENHIVTLEICIQMLVYLVEGLSGVGFLVSQSDLVVNDESSVRFANGAWQEGFEVAVSLLKEDELDESVQESTD